MSKDEIAWWSGEFASAALEKEFRASQARSEVRQIRLVWGLALACFLLYWPLDLLAARGDERLLWPRVGIVLVGGGVLLALTSASGRRHRDVVSSLVLLLVMSGYGWILGVRDSEATGALLLLIVGSYLFSPCRFLLQVLTGAGGSVLALLAYGELQANGWREFSYLLPANVLAAVALARANHARRRLYRQGRVLAAEIEKRRCAQARLAALNARNQALLYNALPVAIARQLQANPNSRPARALPSVAIVFTDIVGFSELSRSLSAPRLVLMLDTLFAVFDRLTARHGLEKIKTVGDAYLAIARRGSVAQMSSRSVSMALQQRQAAAQVGQKLGIPLRLRIGIHRGPLVAGVLGRHRYAFDIWGPSVNIASRLQTAAPAGAILASVAVSGCCPAWMPFSAPRELELRGCGSILAQSLESELVGSEPADDQGRGLLG